MIPTPATLWASIKAAKMAITLAVIGTLLVMLVVQTFRLEGLSVWPVKIEGWKARANRFEAALDMVADAQITARAAQQAAMDREQARYDELAERTQNAHETTRVVVRDATDAFIRDNGVQTGASCVPSASSAAASGDATPVPVEVPAHVVLDTADVRACGDLYAYALASHLWAVGLAEEE